MSHQLFVFVLVLSGKLCNFMKSFFLSLYVLRLKNDLGHCQCQTGNNLTGIAVQFATQDQKNATQVQKRI